MKFYYILYPIMGLLFWAQNAAQSLILMTFVQQFYGSSTKQNWFAENLHNHNLKCRNKPIWGYEMYYNFMSVGRDKAVLLKYLKRKNEEKITVYIITYALHS